MTWESSVQRRIRQRAASDLDRCALDVLKLEREIEDLLGLQPGEAQGRTIEFLKDELEGRRSDELTIHGDYTRCYLLLKRLDKDRKRLKGLGVEAEANWGGKA